MKTGRKLGYNVMLVMDVKFEKLQLMDNASRPTCRSSAGSATTRG